MPFAVFRRHQRKLLAVFAILAMFGFVVADSLPRLLSGAPTAAGNTVVIDLYGGPVRRSDLMAMQNQRNNANLFMAELTGLIYGRPSPQFFGELNTRAMVDALVLQHEADRLHMPATAEAGKKWLAQRTNSLMTRELFDLIVSRFNNRVSGEEILTDIANQVRLNNVRMLLGAPVVTPLDVFQTYRDQNERVSARAVGFRVEDFLSKAPEPTAFDVQSYYDKYRDALPDPTRPTPGFKVPRQVQVEALSLDGDALARSIKDKLTEADLQTYYENRKADFKVRSEFPDEIFAGAPELTPPQVQTLAEVRPYLATSLAEEKAQAEIVAKFGRIKDEVMIPFADKYLDAADAREEAAKAGATAGIDLPEPGNLKALAEKEGLLHEITPPMTREQAESHGLLSAAEVGLTRMSGGKKFADEVFDAKSTLYEPTELTDFSGHRFLVRKLQDRAPRIPELDEIRPKVVLAWKTEKARPIAEQAAKDYAAKVEADGGKIQGEIVEGRPVITTEPVTRLSPGLPLPGRFFENGPAVPTDIPQLPNAGEPLRDAYFGLSDKSVAVAPDRPEAVYYVLTLNRRLAASFATLYAPNGDYFRYRSETLSDAFKKRDREWLDALRAQAGLPKDWVPEDEARKG